MAPGEVKRKLTAIFSADVVGYSRLMGDDELATVETLTSYKQTMGNLIRHYRGRVVDSTGDNLLAEFASVVDAVQCAVEVQQVLSSKNENLPENRKMHFRIGINLGDVIEEGEVLYGDGVNIAARVESLADPGGICISGSAFEQIENKLALGYQYMGEHAVKNIVKPVKIYKVPLGAWAEPAVEKVKTASVSLWRRKTVLAGAVAVLVAVAGLFVWNFYFRAPSIEPASVDRMALPLPDRPSIAVLPFVNMSGDPKQDSFSDGITEEIITALSKTPRLFVIASTSTSAYKGKPVKIQHVAEDLGVNYVLEGSVRKSENKVRVTAQLIDALKGIHLWAEKYDRDLEDIFEIQDDITREIIVALKVKLTEGEQARIWSRGTENTKAQEKAFESLEHFRLFSPDDVILCRKKAEEAMALDPNYPFAVAMLAWSHLIEVWMGWSKSPGESMKKTFELAQKTLALDENHADAHALLGSIYLVQKQWDKAIEEGKRAVELSPNGADVNALLGISLVEAGRPKEAIPLYKKAIRLNPITPNWYYHNLGEAQMLAGNYQEAISSLKGILEKSPNYTPARFWLIVTYSLADQDEEAKIQMEEFLKLRPKESIEGFRKRSTFKHETDTDLVVKAFRKVGFPEHPPLPLPDKPSIAVLPFVNMSGDPEQEYFSDGITEEIITALSKTPKLFVIARNSTFTYKGKPVKVQQVRRELGVKYVLEGSVRKDENRLRITAQLIDATTGHHLWAERYDRDLKDIFALQDEITMKVIKALELKLTEGEQALIYGGGTKNLEAYLKFLRAFEYTRNMNPDDNQKAKRIFKEAIGLDPNYAVAYRLLGATHMMDVWLGTTKSPKESLGKAAELSRKALSLDESLGTAYAMLGHIYILMRDYDKGIETGQKAIELEPNGADSHAFLGMGLQLADRSEEAIKILKKAIRLNPMPQAWYLHNLASAYRNMGHYNKAIGWAKKAVDRQPSNVFSHLILTSSYSLAGRKEEAEVEAEKVMRINPGFSLERFAKTTPQKNPELKKSYIDSLRNAGLK
jgi:adenylate cyclase